jgi:hypothetical protein
MLGETGAHHPDGTFSVLRAGIDRVWFKEPPARLRGVLIVRLEADRTEKGEHTFEVSCMDEDGRDTDLPKLSGTFTVREGGATSTLLLQMQIDFAKEGVYQFALRIDNRTEDDWKVTVARPESSERTP